MSKSALVIVAPGAEEMEAVIAIDVLRRSEVRRGHFKWPSSTKEW